ncbi:retropepsin-like aspartic protease family protein [Pseudomonas sp. B392_1p]|uniref:retropepsin-like aspartic protease family protein n=1 Tax=Pseudomonas sp. B392_1p TaxID=3457507 RepID=UPI003FD20017
MRRLLPLVSLLLAASLAQAAPEQVLVVGLFPNAAVLNVDGQRKLVKVGQVGPGGVEVVSADSRGAVLRIDGQTRRFELGREYSEGFSAPSKQQISIARGLGGHYWVAGSVDGHPMQFLVDTGATSLAINEQHAKRLGLDYRVKGRPMLASTASGTAKGWKLSVDRVKVGSLEVLGVDTVILEGDAPTEALLGMSFLSRVRWREEQGVLVLESKL